MKKPRNQPNNSSDQYVVQGWHTTKNWTLLMGVILLAAIAGSVGVTALLTNIYTRQQEAKTPFVRLVEVDETTTNPEPWGINWPHQYDSYLRTADDARFYGGSSAMPAQKLEEYPWLKRMYSGYAFALDYREARGHAYMLSDQLASRRVNERTQPGACLHCHASIIPTYRRLGRQAMDDSNSSEQKADVFEWPAIQKGFELICAMDYPEAYEEMRKTPDGTEEAGVHPVSCVDCHDPKTLKSRVTRPGFVNGIAALAASDAPVPHLPSIERWRKGNREKPYDPNRDASRQEMRSYVCAQCHVEYYCGPKETLFFPWNHGLKVEDIELTYDQHQFPDGTAFSDWKHAETGAPVYKAQHPEFELWSQGIHARSGVACTDCHMPYQREGAAKVSSHWVRSPLKNINHSCQTCHNVPESELEARVTTIQKRHADLMDRAADALVAMLDAIQDAQSTELDDQQTKQLFQLQRKAQWRLDYISSENSMGFHADQEAARILAESIDYSRQAATLATSFRAASVDAGERIVPPVEGVTPSDRAPVRE